MLSHLCYVLFMFPDWSNQKCTDTYYQKDLPFLGEHFAGYDLQILQEFFFFFITCKCKCFSEFFVSVSRLVNPVNKTTNLGKTMNVCLKCKHL